MKRNTPPESETIYQPKRHKFVEPNPALIKNNNNVTNLQPNWYNPIAERNHYNVTDSHHGSIMQRQFNSAFSYHANNNYGVPSSQIEKHVPSEEKKVLPPQKSILNPPEDVPDPAVRHPKPMGIRRKNIVGKRVKVFYTDGYYYGIIRSVDEETRVCMIYWDDGSRSAVQLKVEDETEDPSVEDRWSIVDKNETNSKPVPSKRAQFKKKTLNSSKEEDYKAGGEDDEDYKEENDDKEGEEDNEEYKEDEKEENEEKEDNTHDQGETW